MDEVTPEGPAPWWRRLAQFLRLSSIGMTAPVPVTGLGASAASVSGRALAAVLTVGLLFHVGVFVLNDVVDAEIDRTDPRRSSTPLASGAVPRSVGAAVSVLALAGGAAVLWSATADRAAVAWYGAACLGLVLYDLWGKRCRAVAVMDLVQGCGWGSLLLAGAAAAGRVGVGAGLLAVSVCFAIVVANVLGGVRDLRNDARHGARTSATLLVDPRRGWADLPSTLVGYVLGAQVVQGVACAVAAVQLGRHDPGTGRGVAVVVAVLAGQLLALAALVRAARNQVPDAPVPALLAWISIVLVVWTQMLAAYGRHGPVAWVLVTLVLLLPWVGSRFVRSLLRRPRLADAAGRR